MPKKESLDSITRRMQYPEFAAFQRADSLARRLIEKLKPHEIDPRNLDMFSFYPSFYFNREAHDVYMYDALVFLSAAMIATRDIYRKNGINFDERGFLDDAALISLIPKVMDIGLRTEEAKAMELGDLLVTGADSLIQGIETNFYLMHGYDPRKTNPILDRYMKRVIGHISRYAVVGIDLANVMKGYQRLHEAGSIESVMGLFTDRERMFRFLKDGNILVPYNHLLGLHASIHNLEFNEDVLSFSDMIGEEISTVIHLVQEYKRAFRVLSDLAISGKKRLVVPDDTLFIFAEGNQATNEEWKKDWAECLCGRLSLDDQLKSALKCRKSPFFNLDQKMHAFGIPYQVAKKVAEYVEFNVLERTIPVRTRTDMPLEDQYCAVYRPNGNFAAALQGLVERATGKRPNPIAYTSFSEDSGTLNASGIGAIVYVVKNKNGSLRILREDFSKMAPERAFKETMNQFSQEHGDIYVGQNVGVCFVFNSDYTGFIFNPEYSVVEVRAAGKEIEQFDRLSARLITLETEVHETVHAAQVGSRLLWRTAASGVGKYVCETALNQIRNCTLDCGVPLTRFYGLYTKGKTWRQTLVDIITMYQAQALGEGRLAASMQRNGFTNALWESGIEVDEYGLPKSREKIEGIRIEESQTAGLLNRVKKALLQDDRRELKRLESLLDTSAREMIDILETTAETYALMICRDIIKNIPDSRYNDRARRRYYTHLYSGIIRRGLFARDFMTISSAAESDEDLHAKLRQKGMVYRHGIESSQSDVPLRQKIASLGYHPLDPFLCYGDMAQLRRKALKAGMDPEDLLYPINAAKAMLGVRYSSNIPLFMRVLNKYGSTRAFPLLSNVESMESVRNLIN
jgi:hypothetical protein